MPTWAITDDTKSIAIAQDGIVVKNIDKDIVVLRIIPANTGLNTTTTDVLSIEHDGEYATRIPYNDVTVSGVSPSSADDFRTKVLTILNNNSSGGSSASITVTRTVAVQMEGATSGQTYPVENQWYIIQNLHITGVDQIRTIGVIDQTTGNGIFDKNAEAYITALATYVPCTYDVGTNKVYCKVEDDGIISQSGTSSPVLTITNKNIKGITYTPQYTDVGLYGITPSVALSAVFTKITCTVQCVLMDSSLDIALPFTHAFSYYNLGLDEFKIGTQLVDGTPTNALLNDTPISIIGYIYN